jgi:hypothetical protein
MIALEAEDVARRLARSRQLPGTAVGELEAGAGIGAAAAAHVPLVGHRHLFREVQRHCPAGKRRGTGVGDAHVHLEERTARVGRRCRATVRGKCMIAQQQAGQQNCGSKNNFHVISPETIVLLEKRLKNRPARGGFFVAGELNWRLTNPTCTVTGCIPPRCWARRPDTATASGTR